MRTTLVATLVAILGGILLGSLAAALSVTWHSAPPPRAGSFQPPFEPVSAPPTARATPAATPTVPEPSSEPPPSATPTAAVDLSKTTLETEGPLPSWLENPLTADADAVTQAAVSCARGNADDCMRAGDAYDAGRGIPANERQARLNRVAGVRLFEAACKKRKPTACYSLSVIYSTGLGVTRNLEAAQGHLTIAQRICRTAQDDICPRLPEASTE